MYYPEETNPSLFFDELTHPEKYAYIREEVAKQARKKSAGLPEEKKTIQERPTEEKQGTGETGLLTLKTGLIEEGPYENDPFRNTIHDILQEIHIQYCLSLKRKQKITATALPTSAALLWIITVPLILTAILPVPFIAILVAYTLFTAIMHISITAKQPDKLDTNLISNIVEHKLSEQLKNPNYIDTSIIIKETVQEILEKNLNLEIDKTIQQQEVNCYIEEGKKPVMSIHQ